MRRWVEYLTTPYLSGDAESDAIVASNYHWWHVWPFWNYCGTYGLKLGPLTILAYQWFDDRWRVSLTWRCGLERIIFGGQLS